MTREGISSRMLHDRALNTPSSSSSPFEPILPPVVLNLDHWDLLLPQVVNANLYAPTKATNLLKYLREGASLHFKDRDPDPLPSLASSWCRNLPSSVTEEQQVKILKDIKDEVTLSLWGVELALSPPVLVLYCVYLLSGLLRRRTPQSYVSFIIYLIHARVLDRVLTPL